ncbi:BnaAnng39740D [Brassica napus]|uniref:BnaAnng39740D protein n=1 Tax=Brassica napus TaxID=3708 RepID=A0A078K2A2_BRANA|nr:BnaAnng39740D [Brassica napus]
MSDRVTYRDMGIMEEVLNQRQKQVCWAISLTRQLAALLKLRGQLNINASLSIQYLINKVGSSLFGAQMPRPWNGSVRSLETAIPFLVNGTVLENLVPLRQFDLQSSTPENHVLGERRYRAVRIVVHRIDEYRDEAAFEADLLRCLHQSPVAAVIKLYPSYGHITGNQIYRQRTSERDEATPLKHSMLYAFGTPYWEFQDSSGKPKGGVATKAVSVDASHKRPKKVHKRLSLGPGKQSKSHKLSQGLWSSNSTSREAGSFVRPISPKSLVPSASAFENMGESDDDIAELDASYLQTNGYLPPDATEEQISMAAASMIRSHSLSEFDALCIVYNKFHSVLSPEIIEKESEVGGKLGELDSCEIEAGETKGEILQNLAEFQFSCVMFNAVLENACSEMGAGMSAMDSSSRNAGEMLDRLTLAYNRELEAA